ncbi:anthrone oxygenase family protein [Paracoccus spongiarum]|uniref:DUF1772 domain-containing protein n=1 Tax=Paracoccus spongiarum TaxID=3064387 RepID=A0ABT9J9P4_9RHOB|nr:anthrone oxygenase family protein [Paracoccus sp. 2205BS29-5]MDP5305806.1 DUF1772 domain-containing protein [Paracoccus sp. 2205BS29-5]
MLFAAAGALCLFGAVLPTLLVNVPMNEALGQVDLPLEPAEARRLWGDYSPRWQAWNLLRCVAMGGAVLLAGLAIAATARRSVAAVAG